MSQKKAAQAAPETRQTAPGSTIAPPVDPGPPPRFPEPPAGSWPFGMTRIRDAGRQKDRRLARAQVSAVPTLRLGPVVSRYKAEVLAWLDAMDAYEASLP